MTAVLGISIQDEVDRCITLGAALLATGNADEAEQLWDRAIEVANESPAPYWPTASLRLERGDYARGWADYEERAVQPWHPVRPFLAPRWDGASITDGTLFVWAEQGLGDTLMMLRYLPLIAERVERVVLEVQAPLVSLVSRLVDCEVRAAADAHVTEPWAAHIPMCSLPFVFGTTVTTVPQQLALDFGVDADPDRIGLCWTRAPWQSAAPEQDERCLPPAMAMRLVDGLAPRAVVSCQEHTWPIDALATAQRLARCGAVVTTDRWIAHLAGLLGIETLVLLHRLGEWRWQRGDRSTWHPTAQCFRQPTVGDWASPIAAVLAHIT